ncbi:MAG: NAD(+) synthase [Saccharofermentans sp.]|nr:NAD(+) synthase [Saccharofermentans sp.]
MKDGFLRVGAATPEIRVGDCAYNSDNIIECVKQAAANDCSLLVFPELCITGYTCGDLFLSDTLINAAKDSLMRIAEETKDLDIAFVVGIPVRLNNKLYNCGASVCKGRIMGFSPKTNIPNYSEFYELRHFIPFDEEYPDMIFGNMETLMGKLIYDNSVCPRFSYAVEICEDLWATESPSLSYCIEGANIICNLSASDEVIGKEEFRRDLVKMQSAKCCCVYIYADCGYGESTQDLIFSGHNIIAENGKILAESKLFENGIIYADVDLQRIASDRRRMNTFKVESRESFRETFDFEPKDIELKRFVSKTPFVPEDNNELDDRCAKIIKMQASGLYTRLKACHIDHAVVGLSGGLDSTLALIVTAKAFEMAGIPSENIISVTMPCFGTTDRTYNNAVSLAKAYKTGFKEINIKDSVLTHFKDIGHDEHDHDVTYENSQARERTQVLMDLANQIGGLVVGTGDLSELALGWATYNGDHMSMYGVNGSIPKTLVRHLVSHEALAVKDSDEVLSKVLEDIVATPVSPELLPPTEGGNISQKTEEIVGPYELHDFFLYYFIRFGFAPSKIFRLAKYAFAGSYDDETIYKWLSTFIRRFFTQQFKRSCLPDGPKVGTVALSPRGDWRMPSDASYAVWMEDLEKVKL